MPEYGMAIEVKHTDKEWKINPKEPFIWAPPLPADVVEITKRAVIYNFKRSREETTHPELATATKFEFVHGPVRYYIETVYQLDEEDSIVYDQNNEAIILDVITHFDTWMYPFAWYVNTEPLLAVRALDGTTTAWMSESNDKREVIEVPL